MLFIFDERQSDKLAAKVFGLFRLIRERVCCKSASESTFLDIAVLGFVKAKGSPTMKEVAAALRVSPPAATSAIDKLMEKKYLKRIDDAADRRIVRLSLTDKGEKEVAAGRDTALESVDSILSALDRDEQKALEKLITKILNKHA